MKTPNPNQEALNLKKEIIKMEKKILNLQFANAERTRKLELICIHDKTEKKHEYQPGGYLERCRYINKVVCTVCGKVIEKEEIVGGFN